jgi:general secretion pathway protein G
VVSPSAGLKEKTSAGHAAKPDSPAGDPEEMPMTFAPRSRSSLQIAQGNRDAFTLVEILIVVVILGILAALVIPQFANASQDARKANMRNQLQTVRGTIGLYRVEHRDIPPKLITTGWTAVTSRTKTDGTIDPAGDRGPYLPNAPVNPLTLSSSIVALGTTPALSNGWFYDENTGEVHGADQDGAMSDTGD